MEDAKTVLKMIEMFATGDRDVLGSVVAADYVDHQGFGGRELHGPEGAVIERETIDLIRCADGHGVGHWALRSSAAGAR